MKKYTIRYFKNLMHKQEITILANTKKDALEIAKRIIKTTN